VYLVLSSIVIIVFSMSLALSGRFWRFFVRHFLRQQEGKAKNLSGISVGTSVTGFDAESSEG
jgi:hypothetical protein